MARLRGLYFVPPGSPFAQLLAKGVIEAWGADPLRLSKVTIFLPTRRACRSLRDAFLDASQGGALILPRLVPLRDFGEEALEEADAFSIDADGLANVPPAMPALERQLILARLIREWERAHRPAAGEGMAHEHALRLAKELARFIDQVETEGLDFAGLRELVPEDYARHWQETLSFLRIVTDWWPAIEAERGALGPAKRYALLVEQRIERWRAAPPEEPIVIAGSTGSVPATRALMRAVLALPRGAVVLPGLERDADEALWAAMADDPTHPQFGLATLLAALGETRRQVRLWPGSETAVPQAAMSSFVSAAMVPASATARWQEIAVQVSDSAIAETMRKVWCFDCADPGDEGRVAALLLREALEEPGRTAALVTPDRTLARRVAGELKRWNLPVDDSAGVPLAKTVPGNFLRLLAQAAMSAWAPLELLALLKHPLASGGLAPGRFRAMARRLELAALRGVRPRPGLDGVIRLLESLEGEEEIRRWFAALASGLSPFEKLFQEKTVSLDTLIRQHLEAAEMLAASDDQSGAERIWREEAGEHLAQFFSEVLSSGGAMPSVVPLAYPGVLEALLDGQEVRPRFGSHPRLAILGPLEARLQRYDRIILGGLNEGIWPAGDDPGPWLSRPMRETFGLPSPERRIGLAAHDFSQAFSAGEVILTRAQRSEGSPTVPSRWLRRLDALAELVGARAFSEPDRPPYRSWSEALDRPDSVRPIKAPEPRPPVAARPRSLSVTQIETWMRDPYALYARHVLRLRALDPIDADPGLAERGSLIHAALEGLIRAHPRQRPADAESRLIAIGRELFAPVAERPALWSFWWPRFLRVAAWVVGIDREEKNFLDRSWVEVGGRLTFDAPAGSFQLSAKADRIDRLRNGGYRILDYKTGRIPSKAEVLTGPACQLPLEAAILAGGGFEEIDAGEVEQIVFWKLSGGEPPGEEKPVVGDPGVSAKLALDRLRELVATFDDETAPYLAEPQRHLAPRYSDYRHLSRIREWSVGSVEDGT